MIFRRLRERISRQDWLGVGIDFLILIVGVFLGLQAQDWNQSRLDRKTERDYLERLQGDFSTIVADLERCLDLYGSVADATRVVEEAVFESDPDATDADLGPALIRMTADTIPPGRSITFIEMLSSGELGLIRNAELSRALIAYDERAIENREIWRLLRDSVTRHGGSLYAGVRLDVDLERSPMVRIEDYRLEALAEDRSFRALLTILRGAAANSYELCTRQRLFASEAVELLAVSLED